MILPLRILILKDSDNDTEDYDRVLEKEGISFTKTAIKTFVEFEKGLIDFQPEVVISDYSSSFLMDSLNLFRQYKQQRNPLAIYLIVAESHSEEFAVNLLKGGVDDYLLKDRLARLPSAILGAIKKNQLEEEKRKAEEEKLHLLDVLQRNLSEIYIFSSDTLKFKYVNEEALRNLGFRLDEITNLTPLNLLENASEDEFRKILHKITLNKKGKIFETYATRKDKSLFPVQVHLQLLEKHGGKRTFLANVLDITEIRSQEQQKELALFIQMNFNRNKSLEGSLEKLLEGICRRHDMAAADFFAYNYENTVMRRFAVFSEVDVLSEDLGMFLSQRTCKKDDFIYYDKPKEDIPLNLLANRSFRTIKSFPIGLGGEIVAVINFYSEKDLSEKNFLHLGEGLRNQIANNLKRKRSESELIKIFEYSPDILAIACKDGYFKKVNPSFSRILGFSTEELLSTPIVKLIHPGDAHFIKEWESCINENRVLYYETRYLTKKGDFKWIAWSVTTFLDKDLSFAVGKDITAFRGNLEALELQNKKLAEIAWEQSHVVRAPLARLMGCVLHLEETHDHMEELLENIKSSAAELDVILKNIVSRAELIKNK